MQLIDIGCNLTSSRLFSQAETHIKEAQQAGVVGQILTGTDVLSSEMALSLTQDYPNLWATAGMHPHQADSWLPHKHRIIFQTLAKEQAVVAVGEMGLDYWRGLASIANQQRAFEDQLAIAQAIQKPIFLHEREAFLDFKAILDSALAHLAGGVWHCFTADFKALDWALTQGLYIGITGWICDPVRGATLRQLVRDIPDNRLLLETDAPYLTPKTLNPMPRHNAPKYLPEVLNMVATCRGQDTAQLAQISTDNACRLFSLSLDTTICA